MTLSHILHAYIFSEFVVVGNMINHLKFHT